MIALRRRTLLAAVLAGGTVTACTDDGDTADGDAGGADGASDGGGSAAAAAPSAVVAGATALPRRTAAPRRRAELTARVHPLVRSREHLVLTLDLTAEGEAADLEEQELLDGDLPNAANYAWSDGWGSQSGDMREFLGVRLVDLAGDQVASTA